MSLSVNSFGGGVALLGSADTRKVDEILRGDSVDIGPRGALICTTDRTDYVTIEDENSDPWSSIFALVVDIPGGAIGRILAIGQGEVDDGGGGTLNGYAYALLARVSETSPVDGSVSISENSAPGPAVAADEGAIVTSASFPGVFDITAGALQVSVSFFNVGAREGFTPNSNDTFGLYIAFTAVGTGSFDMWQIERVDALGTGPFGEFVGGTESQQLFFRGILAYNNHMFGWGFDSADATNKDGPCRVMFSNLGNPLKWGNDNQEATGNDRAFTDSDAIVLGSAGEIIRAAIAWNGSAYFFTNRQGHYIRGYGRDSFLTDGSTIVVGSYNVVGPKALIEGPDRKLYGVGDEGLWRTADGVNFEPLFLKLRDFTGQSNGYFDLIWVDPTRTAAALPGRTNMDLVWMAVDPQREQVLVGIPWCDSITGYGYGLDTVVIKFHVRTGGFTRQVFEDVQLTAVGYFRREGQQPETRFLGTATTGEVTVQRYGYSASPNVAPVMPEELPAIELGQYSPFGPDGRGVIRRYYLTLEWTDADSLPLVFTLTPTVDGSETDVITLSVQNTEPAAPNPGDLWVDTSESDTSLGNDTSSSTITATGGYLLKTRNGGAWVQVAGMGQHGTKVTIPVPVTRKPGDLVTMSVATTAAAGRFQVSGFGINPGGGEANA